MVMSAILVKRPGPFEQTFVPPCHTGFILDFASTAPVVATIIIIIIIIILIS